MTKIFITGICGFVGSAIAENLVIRSGEYEIFGMDNLARPGSWVNRAKLKALGITVYHGDVRLASDLNDVPKADWVIDAAANPSVLAGLDGISGSLQLVEHNLQATVNILEYCKRHLAGLILLSTSRVYSIPGLSDLILRTENDAYVPDAEQDFPIGISSDGINESYSTKAPISLYGCTKLSSECLAVEYGLAFDFPVWINRCGVLAGPGQFGTAEQGIFAFWIHSVREGKPLKYIGFGGRGYQVRDGLHPRDLISLMIKQFREPLKSDKPRIVNVSGGIKNSRSLAQLNSWCEDYFNLSVNVSSAIAVRKFDIPWMVLNAANAKEVWDWEPATKIEDIFFEIAEFAKAHPDWCRISTT